MDSSADSPLRENRSTTSPGLTHSGNAAMSLGSPNAITQHPSSQQTPRECSRCSSPASSPNSCPTSPAQSSDTGSVPPSPSSAVSPLANFARHSSSQHRQHKPSHLNHHRNLNNNNNNNHIRAKQDSESVESELFGRKSLDSSPARQIGLAHIRHPMLTPGGLHIPLPRNPVAAPPSFLIRDILGDLKTRETNSRPNVGDLHDFDRRSAFTYRHGDLAFDHADREEKDVDRDDDDDDQHSESASLKRSLSPDDLADSKSKDDYKKGNYTYDYIS